MKKNLLRWLVGCLIVFASTVMAVPTTPTEDFTDNGDGTVTHRITGLTWMRCAMGMMWDGTKCTGTYNTYTWDQTTVLTANFAGKSDWRLPSIAELNTIVERSAYNPAINATIFPNTPASSIWSASADASLPSYAWVGGDGVVSYAKSDRYPVRLVRAGQSFDSLALYTPTADFIDNGDGTVMHRKTGLMWKRCAEGQTWSGSTCSASAAANDWDTAVALTSSSAGYNDWRLPTANELQTIVEYRTNNPAINTTIFPNTSASFFWSASAGAYNSSFSWVVGFDRGYVVSSGKSNGYRVRLVRVGQIFGIWGFTAQAGVDPNVAITSNALKATDIGGPTPIAITGGSYAINGGAYTTAAGTVNPNDSVTVRVIASLSPSATTQATLTIGGVSGDFRVTTRAAVSQAPSVPNKLTAMADGDNRINLAWSAASDNVGVAAYQLYRNGSWLAKLGSVTSYGDSGLSAATTYTYQVAACDAANNCSAQSMEASATTPVAHVLTPTTPSSEYTDNGDGTVTHKITGLTWMRCAMGQTWTGTTCTGTANTYTWNQATALTANFAGKSDWRLPSIAELNSIVERKTVDPAINITVFPNTPASGFWSASAYNYGSGLVWGVSFVDGYVYGSYKDVFVQVRLVRGGQSFEPLALNTPTTDFIDNGDGTVTHRKTGLMWKRCAEGQTWSGSTCSGYVATYGWNTAVALTSSSAGHNDWRLPTANELQTIVEYQQPFSPGTISFTINATIFPDSSPSSSFFWSASTDAGDSSSAWGLFVDGKVNRYGKGSAGQVRLVRAGQLFGIWGFTAQAGVEPNVAIVSNALKVAGISGATPIAIIGGSYAINGGVYTSAAGTVNPNDSVTVKVTASPNLATTTHATLAIGGVSGDFTLTTRMDTQPPSTPSALTATPVSASQVNLAWGATSDNTGVTIYRLYRNGALLAIVGNVTSYSDTQLAGATSFKYSAEACDAANNCSALSSVATVTISGSVRVAPMLAAGANHSAGLKNDGTLWLWGYNDSGQLGDGATVGSRTSPQAVGPGYSIMALGGSHSVAIKADGSLWTWGANASGQLGDGTTSTPNGPTQIGTGYIAVAAGNSHTLGVKGDGSLWAWGKNGSGQLGDGTTNSRNTPTQIGTGYYTVAAGTSHSVALKIDGSLWAWGSNNDGRLGDGTGNDRYAPTLIGSGFTDVATGANHTIALKTDGSLWAWGKNDTGQLGNSTNLDRYAPIQISTGYSAIATGSSHSLALKPDGTVWAWGSNAAGQLGDGTTTNQTSPVKVPSLSGIIAIATGGNSSLALKSDGTVLSWGANNAGQLGDGTFTQQTKPVLVVNDTVTGFLDLIPDTPNTLSAEVVPPFLVKTDKFGDLSSLTLKTDVYGLLGIGFFGSFASAGYNLYVAAYAGTGSTLNWYQLNASKQWSSLTWPMAQFMSGVSLDKYSDSVVANIFQDMDVSQLIGSHIYVGYGTDANEMASAKRYREIMTISK